MVSFRYVAAYLLVLTGVAAAQTTQPNLRVTNEVKVYQSAKDAVVNITTTKLVTTRVGMGDEFFDRFFPGQIRQVPAQSLGSGFVIHSSGYIITNEHVIDQATEVQVVFSNNEKLEAQVIATDAEHDLAVLKVTPKKPLQTINLGTSDDLMIGEPVYAIGNPFGYAGTMTRGIVSAVDRTLEAGPNKSYKGLIQTDASINPGNSGGPLLNAYGQVIGVNTAIRADAHGIGFAIAISRVRDLLPAFLNAEATNRAEIGFTVEEKRNATPPNQVASQVLIKGVAANSAASKAGLSDGMRIVSINKTQVTTIVDALVTIAAAKPGDTLSMTVMKGNAVAEVNVPVSKAPTPESEALILSKTGLETVTITPALAKKQKLAVAQGILINGVKLDSPAAKAGIKPGDVLFQLGRYYVNSNEDVATLLKTVDQEMDVQVGIVRGNTRGRAVIRIK